MFLAQTSDSQRQLLFQGLASSGWLWFLVICCVFAAGMVALLMKYERQLVPAKVGWTLLVLRLTVIGVLLLTFLQPIVSWTRDRDRSGKIVVAIDVSRSMETTDTYATKAELLRLARALEMIGNQSIDARLDEWVAAYERGEEPQWVSPNEAASDQRRDELSRLRKKNAEDVIESARELTRREIAVRLLTQTSQPLLDRISEVGEIELRAFATKSEAIDISGLEALVEQPPGSLSPTATSLVEGLAVSSASDDSAALAGVVVLSDGQHNLAGTPVDPATRLGAINVPVVPIMIGSTQKPRDLSIISLDYPQVAFRNDTPVLRARVGAAGFREEEITITLEDEDGNTENRVVRVPGPGLGPAAVEVEFPLEANEAGRFEYKLRTDVRPDETRDDNNERSLAIRVVEDKSHVLLLEGEARWEFRFIDNAYERDERVELQHVVFKQPYIGVLPTTFFPKSLRLPPNMNDLARSPFASLDMVVVGDVSPQEITDSTWQFIEHFVKEEGGTLVMLAGKNSFPHGHRSDSVKRLVPMQSLRTVELTLGQQEVSPKERGFHLTLTPDGERQSMLQFSTDSIRNRDIWNDLPGHSWGLLGEARPGATVWAHARRGGEPSLQDERSSAAIVHQYYGFGQVVWLGIDSTWRWRHRVGDQYHHRFWGQLARWAAENKAMAGNQFVRLALRSDQIELGEDAMFQVRWQQSFLDQNPNLKGFIEIYREPDDGTGRPFARLELKPVDGRPLLGEARASGLPAGSWRVKLAVENANLGAQEVATALYVQEPVTGELSDLSANRDLLTRMAEVSGSELLLPDETDEVIDLLRLPEDATEHRQEVSLWDHWLMLTLFFGLLTVEWLFRKLNGLP